MTRATPAVKAAAARVMSRDLTILRSWAESKAATDDDHDARPLWSQIAKEVGAYLDDEPPVQDGPGLWEEA